MSEQFPTGLSPEQMGHITEAMQTDEELALRLLDQQCAAYRDDARLPMLRGALLASRGEHERAGRDLRDALALAPQMHVARFLLGYLELVTGAPERAVRVWEPLLELDDDPVLQAFGHGMVLTAQNRLAEAQVALRTGLEAGDGYPELASWVHVLEQALREAAPGQTTVEEGRHWLLGGYQARH